MAGAKPVAGEEDRWSEGAWSLASSRGGSVRGKLGATRTEYLLMLAAACVAVIGFELANPRAFHAPGLRAAIETGISLAALAGAWTLRTNFRQTGRVRDLLLLVSLVTLGLVDTASYALPATLGLRIGHLAPAAPLIGNVFMAAAFAAAALTSPTRLVANARLKVSTAIGAGFAATGLAELGGWLLGGQLVDAAGRPAFGIAAAGGHPLALVFSVGAAALLAVAAFRFAGEARSGGPGDTALLAAAAILLMAARLHYLALPALTPDWVTTREGVRVCGFMFILAAVAHQDARLRVEAVLTAASNERKRMARDLHDGLAQDLAFIAAHGARMAVQDGAEHPIAIAARRALAISRGAIADLSATQAPTVQHALRQVADELELRFGISVDVDAQDVGLDRADREEVVRIAREGIVNAANHGRAQNVLVTLTLEREQLVLRIRDDGAGIGTPRSAAQPGFGMTSMNERAAALGGLLSARQPADGGTELELVVPS